MPDFFEITTEVTETVMLDNRNRGEVLFKLVNLSGRPVYTRVRCEPDEPDTVDWFSFAYPAERHFIISDVAYYIVKIAASSMATVGRYQFQLVIVERDKPDDHFTVGPPVTFEVVKPPAPAQPPFRFPNLPKLIADLPRRTKLIAGGALAALVVLAVVVAIILSLVRPSLPDLVIESLHAQELSGGQQYLFTIEIANRGSRASGTFEVGYYTSPEGMLETEFRTVAVDSIAPGEARTLEIIGYLTPSLRFRNAVITFVADIDEMVRETNKDNNAQSISINLPTIQPTPTPAPTPTPTFFLQPTPAIPFRPTPTLFFNIDPTRPGPP